jgi:DNA repair photolyase
VLIAPLMPGINDSPEEVERILELAAEAGAVDVGGVALHLRGEVKELWFEWLREHRPDLVPRYERLYRRGAYAPAEERKRLAGLVNYRGGGSRGRRSLRGVDPGGPGSPNHAGAKRLGPPVGDRQETLF